MLCSCCFDMLGIAINYCYTAKNYCHVANDYCYTAIKYCYAAIDVQPNYTDSAKLLFMFGHAVILLLNYY